MMEKLIHKAKRGTNADNNFLYRTLYKPSMIVKLREEIAPRFKDLPAGFTRIENLGHRLNDKAPVSMIEIIGNEIAEFQKNEQEVEIAQYGLESYWEWENKLLTQEVDYYENKLRQLKMTIDDEVSETLMTQHADAGDSTTAKIMTDNMSEVDKVKQDTEAKYAN